MGSPDEKFMLRCLQLAENGKPNAFPNPLVGSVIVYKGKIIGEGFHAMYGKRHAEVMAIHSVKEESLLQESILYVNLEPCAHYGKTPPCAELIIEKKIPRVVIGMKDPFSLVAGEGINMLRNAGIEVVVGILEKECKELNKFFLTYHTHHRPYIILKWAQTSDGYIDHVRSQENISAAVISNPVTQLISHKLRAETDAILVGTNTVLKDNPSLTTRLWKGSDPMRIFPDRNKRISDKHTILNDFVPTIVFTENSIPERKENTTYVRIDFTKNIIPQILNVLYEKKIQSLVVEGGNKLLTSFIDAGCWDEAAIEISRKKFKEGTEAPLLSGDIINVNKFDDSEYFVIQNKNQVKSPEGIK